MTVVLLLSSVVWAPAAGAEGETISLAEADIQITEVCYYDGSPQTPKMTVTLHTKVLTEGLDYTTTYQNNVDAGTATVTVTGEGIYSGSASALFTIHPRKVDAEDFSFDVNSCSKNYDGTTEAFPEIDLKVIAGDTVEVSYQKAEYESQYVDDSLLITVSGITFTGEDGKNYSLREQNMTLSNNQGEIRPLAIQFENNKKLAMGCSLDLRELISNGWDKPVRFEWDSGGAQKGCSIEDSSILKAGERKGTITIYASTSSYNVDGVGKEEYLSSSYQPLKIEIVDQEEQAPLSLVAEGQPSSAQVGTATVYYGQTLDFDVQGGSGTGNISFHLQEEYGLGGAGTMDPSTGSFTATEVGKVIVTAQRAGDDRYEDITSNTIVVTILPAPLTIQVKDKTARIGDAIPTLTAADYTVTGLVGSDTLAQAPQPHLCVHPGHEQNRSGGHPGFRGGHPQWELRSQHHVPPRGAHHPGDPHLYCHSANGGERDDHRRQGHCPGGGYRHPHRPPGRGICIAVTHRDLRCCGAGHSAAPGEGGGDLHLCHARRGRHRHRNLRPGRGGRGTLAALPLYRCAGDHVVL